MKSNLQLEWVPSGTSHPHPQKRGWFTPSSLDACLTHTYMEHNHLTFKLPTEHLYSSPHFLKPPWVDKWTTPKVKVRSRPPLDMTTILYFTAAEIGGSNVPLPICEGEPPISGIGHTSLKTALLAVALVRRPIPLENS